MSFLKRIVTAFVLSLGGVVYAADGVDRFFANGLDHLIGSECIYEFDVKGTKISLAYTITDVEGDAVRGEFKRTFNEKDTSFPLEFYVRDDGIFFKKWFNTHGAYSLIASDPVQLVKFPIEINEQFETKSDFDTSDLNGQKFKGNMQPRVTPKKWTSLQVRAGETAAVQMSRSVKYSGVGWSTNAREENHLSDSPCFVRSWTYRDGYNNKGSVELVSETTAKSDVSEASSTADSASLTADEAAAAAEEAARAAQEAARVAAEKAAAAKAAAEKAAAEKAAAEKAAAEAAKKVSIVFSFQDGSGATVVHQVDGSSLSPAITSCDLGLTVKDVVRIYDTLPMRYADFKVLDMRCVGN